MFILKYLKILKKIIHISDTKNKYIRHTELSKKFFTRLSSYIKLSNH